MSDSLSQCTVVTYFIKYNPLLIQELGSQNAVILFDRLEYWFAKKKDQFYKFIEPCQHPCFRQGDSWQEELGFSKKVFRTAFDKIGIRYPSKTAFENEVEPFKGRFFAYFQDRQSKKTIFVRNHDLLRDLYDRLKTLNKHKADMKKNKASSSVSMGPPTADPLGSPYASAEKDKQINTSSLSCDGFDDKLEQRSDKNEEIRKNNFNDMLSIWSSELGDNHPKPQVTSKLETVALQGLYSSFAHDLEQWRKYCSLVASSKFLMGERERYNGNEPFKAWFEWALKPENIQRVKAREFGIGDRIRPQDKLREKQDYETLLEKVQNDAKVPEVIKRYHRELADYVNSSMGLSMYSHVQNMDSSMVRFEIHQSTLKIYYKNATARQCFGWEKEYILARAASKAFGKDMIIECLDEESIQRFGNDTSSTNYVCDHTDETQKPKINVSDLIAEMTEFLSPAKRRVGKMMHS